MAYHSRQKKILMQSHHHLPEEIILDILSQLPAKFLTSLKIISKDWNSLISNPTFYKTYIADHQPHILFTTSTSISKNSFEYFSINLHDKESKANKLEVERPSSDKWINPNDSYNEPSGLVLLDSCNDSLLFRHNGNRRKYYIYNLVRNERYGFSTSDMYHRMFLVYDNCIGKFKLIGTDGLYSKSSSYSNPTTNLAVFTQGGHHNGEEFNFSAMPGYDSFPNPVFVQNELHFLNTVKKMYIFSFNVSTYGFRKTNFQASRKDMEAKLLVVKGSLCVVKMFHQQIETWLLQDSDKGVWTKSSSITLESLPNKPRFLKSFLSSKTCIVLDNYTSDLRDILHVIIQCGNKLFVYDLKKNEWREIARLEKGQNLSNSASSIATLINGKQLSILPSSKSKFQ